MNKAKITKIARKMIPVLYIAALFVGTYYLTKVVTAGRTAVNPTTVIDDLVPLWTPSVAVYFLAFFEWAFGAVFIMFQDDPIRKRAFASIFCAIVISSVIFIVMPTYTVRPEITGSGFFDRILAWIYEIDEPTNVLPSYHCLASWMVTRLLLKCPSVPKWLNTVNTVFAFFVFASVLLTKQHLFLDIPAALIVAEISFFITGKYMPDKLLDKLLLCGEAK